MPKEEGRIRVYGHAEVEVELVAAYLADLKHAYDSVLVFETVISGLERAARELPYPWYFLPMHYGWPLGPRRAVSHVRDWPPTGEEISSLVRKSEQLVLAAVQLTSPGFWEFVGKLNPLEVVRQYLNDRHERRKDREYRESAERRRLYLENLSLENRVLSERVRLAKELGASEQDLAPLLNELVYRPLTALDRHQDQGVIEYAEMPRQKEKRER